MFQLRLSMESNRQQPYAVFRQELDRKQVPYTHWFRSEIHIRPGLSVILSKHPPEHPRSYRFRIAQAPLSFGFFLSGNHNLSLTDRNGQPWEFDLLPGKATVSYFPDSQGRAINLAEAPVMSLVIAFDPSWLGEVLTLHSLTTDTDLDKLIKGDDIPGFFHEVALSSAMRVAVEQIFRCEYTGSLRTIFLEGKVLELLTLRMACFTPSSEEDLMLPCGCSDDHILIQRAESILTEDIQNPPSLFALAREVGLSHPRLNRGFRKVYGNTVFGYLRTYRLEQARSLLMDANVNIADVAYECGFSSPSHLSSSFMKAYKCSPGQYRDRHQLA